MRSSRRRRPRGRGPRPREAPSTAARTPASAPRPGPATPTPGTDRRAMRTTTLGSSGPTVGVLGLGCMGMTHAYDPQSARDDATSIAVIREALDLGMTLIDTADVSGPFSNEQL